VFVDECGTHTFMSRLRARAPKGERAYGRVPRNRGKNTTLIASMTHEGMGPCMAVVGSTRKAVFEAYVERVLAPSLRPGQVVVMDNLGAHRGDGKSKARSRGALVEATGRALSAITSRTQRATSDTAATRSTLDHHENRCQHSPSRLSAPRKPTVLAIAPSQPKHGLRSRRIFRR
jgi:hypothetical protein